jgi:NAD(P)-dependent dehydrogenase (short-subunit alcohol dehydrogenase family)
MPVRFADKVWLVTGGAGGIGRAVVEGAIAEGAKVAFTDITDTTGPTLETQLRERGADVVFIRSNATIPGDVATAVDAVVLRWGRLDVAINNVGNFGREDRLGDRLHETSVEGWDGTIAQSLTSTFLGMKFEIAHMLAQGGGVIGNTISAGAIRYSDNTTAAYAAAKAGVLQMTRLAAIQYAKLNIRINAVAPGATASEAMKESFTQEEQDAMAAALHPMGKMAEPEDVAAAFLWLCSDEAQLVTGHYIPVDGGWHAL